MTVSIVIPVYQVSDYVERCLKSVLNQTYKDIECIIVDDCSRDDSIAKCERLIERYDGLIKCKILHHKKNRGLSAARNTGTEAATGEYVYYLDGDDELTNSCIEKLVRPTLDDPDIEMVMGNHQRIADGCVIDSSERLTLSLVEKGFNSNEEIRDFYYCDGLYPAAWNKLTKLDFLKRNGLLFKEGAIWEDTLWTFYIVKYLNHFHTIPDVTYYYIKRLGALTTGMVEGKELTHHWCLVYDEIATHFTNGEIGKEARFHMQGLCYKCINVTENKEFYNIANKYSKALFNEKYFLNWSLLNLIISISRFSYGREFFQFAANHLIGIQRKIKKKTRRK